MGAIEYHCPGCHRVLPTGLTNCPDCSLQLVGPGARKLWELDQLLIEKHAERDQLVASLRTPFVPSPPTVAAANPPQPKRFGPSGQQLVLALGALLLLAAVSFFVVVFWLVVGVVGQAIILLGLVAIALVATRLAVRRGLDATAETAAVIAIGLVLLTTATARAKGLFGLDGAGRFEYWSGAGAVIAVLLVGFDRLTPPGPHGRRILSFLPAANVAWAWVPWFALAAFDPVRLHLALGLLGVLMIAGGHLTAAARRFPHLPWVWGTAGVSAALASLGYQVVTLVEAYRLDTGSRHRYLAALMSLLLPVALLAARRWARPHLRAVQAADTAAVTVVATLIIAAAVVPTLDLGLWPLAALALGLACLLAGTMPSCGLPAVARGCAATAVPVVVAGMVVLRARGAATGRQALLGHTGVQDLPLTPVVIAAAGWAVACLAGVAVRRTAWWIIAAQIAMLATGATFLWGLTDAVGATLAVTWCVAQLGLAAAAARDRVLLPATSELSALAAAAVAGGGGLILGAIAWHSPRAEAVLLYVIGVAVAAYSTSPRRLGASYLGALIVSGGTWLLLSDAGVSQVEAYTAPLAALLALIGLARFRREPASSSLRTIGPALSALLLPSTLVAIGGGDPVRTVSVLAADLALLLLGYRLRLKAPVGLAAVSVVLIGITRGGRLIVHVNGWIVLFTAAAILLTIGARWEEATRAGRRTSTWFSHLR